MQAIFRFISALLSIYMVVILIRVLLTWFRGVSLGRAEQVLASITDPYLNWFRRNIPIRIGMLDFSAVIGILALGLLNNISTQLAYAGTITFAFVLAMIVSAVWSIISFFLTFFLIIAVVRIVGIVAGLDGGGRFWQVLEQILNPMIQLAVRPFLRGRFTSYRDSLLIVSIALVGSLIVGRLITNVLIQLIGHLPF